jgi:RNA polymerase sigma-70 factor (ECF subfamily)
MESFEAYRPLMFAIAYRMLGSASEAEDIVQEAYLRFQAVEPERIQSTRAFLSAVVTRLCLDHLKSAQVKRETYIGTWLPEPLRTDSATLPEPAKQVEDIDSLSMAFLVLLESLTPAERAVFLLREVFDYDYAEIAAMLDKDEAACRQLLSRAKKHIHEHRPRYKSSPQEHAEIFGRFLMACQAGELEGLTRLLAEDVISWSDGGGRVAAATRPLYGREAVARFLLGLTRRAPAGLAYEFAEVNNQLSLVARINGRVDFVLLAETGDGLIQRLRFIRNPDKLAHVGGA